MIRCPSCDLDPHVYSASLDPEPSSVAVARVMLRAALWDWRIDHLEDSAQLIMSELASNAVKFANHVEAVVYLRGRDRAGGGATLVIEVTDDNEHLPSVVDACPDDEGYRGMFLVDALASKWGVDLLDSGKTIWAQLDSERTSRTVPAGC